MQLGLIGLGRMGSGMTLRLLEGGHQVMVYDRVPEAGAALAGKGATAAGSLEDLGQKLKAPRILWLMIPAGPPVDDTIQRLSGTLSPGDIIIDGGNSNYKDSIRRAEALRSQQIEFLDVGVSGGIWGLKVGFNLMIGGNQAVFKQAEPIGFDLEQLATLWNHGSVIRSWLLELAQAAFERDPQLSGIRGYVDDSGEGRWTLQEAIDHAVPAPALAMSLFMRFRSRQDDSFSDKVIAALRNEFGGHPVKTE